MRLFHLMLFATPMIAGCNCNGQTISCDCYFGVYLKIQDCTTDEESCQVVLDDLETQCKNLLGGSLNIPGLPTNSKCKLEHNDNCPSRLPEASELPKLFPIPDFEGPGR
jgi:hypothetical protein